MSVNFLFNEPRAENDHKNAINILGETKSHLFSNHLAQPILPENSKSLSFAPNYMNNLATSQNENVLPSSTCANFSSKITNDENSNTANGTLMTSNSMLAQPLEMKCGVEYVDVFNLEGQSANSSLYLQKNTAKEKRPTKSKL